MKQLLNFTSNPRSYFGFIIILFAFSLVLPAMSNAQCTVEMVIDDFEDGDALDWVFFGGNNAGGGGGVLADRPKEGSYYFSTVWVGQGTTSIFYGGIFKNLNNASQIVLPDEDPYLCFWILNQSNATVDQYTLEITIREDLDGNGWTNGLEDSFGFDTTFQSSAFDDEWKFISIPISEFFNRGTGGNGVFDGDLDEILFIISGVQGGTGSTVEVDFDHIAFCSGPPCTGTINIVKNTIPVDPQDFSFTTSGGLSPASFTLDDDNNTDPVNSNIQTFNNVLVGSYSVTESSVAGYLLSSLTCNDPDNGTIISNGTATIDLDAFETITCTFTNCEQPAFSEVNIDAVCDGAEGTVELSGLNPNFMIEITYSIDGGSSLYETVMTNSLGDASFTLGILILDDQGKIMSIDTIDFANSDCPLALESNNQATIMINSQPNISGRDTTVCMDAMVDLATLISGDLVDELEYGTIYGTYGDPSTSTIQAMGTTTYFVRDSSDETGCVDTAQITVNVLSTMECLMSFESGNDLLFDDPCRCDAVEKFDDLFYFRDTLVIGALVDQIILFSTAIAQDFYITPGIPMPDGTLIPEGPAGTYKLEFYKLSNAQAAGSVTLNGGDPFPIPEEDLELCFVNIDCPALIPTMGQWGLMVLSMIMLIIGIVVLKNATLFRPAGGR